MTEPDLQVMARGLVFPEGPVWQDDGSVIVTEIVGGTVARCAPDGSVTRIADTGGGPNGAAVGPDGALYVCNNGGMKSTKIASRGWILPGEQPDEFHGGAIQRIDLVTGDVCELYSHCDGRRLRGPNDIVFDANGGMWFTDHGKIRERDRDRGGLYYASADGSMIREVVYPLDAPNGVGLSPDGTWVYVVESFTARVWAWEVTGPGSVACSPRARVHGGRLMIGLPGYHLFDSMAVDPRGNLCVATLGDACGITVIPPEGGVSVHLPLPGPMPTNICFGPGEAPMAYATLSAQGELVAWPWQFPDFESLAP
jgi:gluconolactonase